MLHVYRYKWIGVNLVKINNLIDPALPAAILTTGPQPLIDISADDSTKADLDEAMASQGWIYVSTDPATTTQAFTLRQEVATKVVADLSTNSVAWGDLLTTVVTTDGGWLGIIGAATTENVGAAGYMRITLNGAQVMSTVSPIGESNKTLVGRVQVPAGTYTVKLQWRVEAGGTQNVRPISMPEAEFASLLVRDTTT